MSNNLLIINPQEPINSLFELVIPHNGKEELRISSDIILNIIIPFGQRDGVDRWWTHQQYESRDIFSTTDFLSKITYSYTSYGYCIIERVIKNKEVIYIRPTYISGKKWPGIVYIE